MTYIPLINNLCERSAARCHEDLPNAIMELFHRLVIDAQECLGRTLFCLLADKVPDTVAHSEFLVEVADFWQDANLKAAHGKEEIRVVAAVNGHEAVFPLNRRERTWQTVLDIPEDGTTKVAMEPRGWKDKL